MPDREVKVVYREVRRVGKYVRGNVFLQYTDKKKICACV